MTTILFPAEAFSPKAVCDDAFLREYFAAKDAGFKVSLIDHTAVEAHNFEEAFRHTEASGNAIYRGWMLKPSQYAALHSALEGRGIRLLTTPLEYRTCHYFPNCYPYLEGYTPKAVSTPCGKNPNSDVIQSLAKELGAEALIVKDFVKSQKGYWDSACYVPDTSDTEHLERVVRLFLALQADSLNEGLVFKEFVPRLGNEVRTFWYNGELLDSTPGVELPLEWLTKAIAKIPSKFFSVDIAQRADGSWTIIEVGDGQVSGLSWAPEDYYQKLIKRVS